MILKNTYAKVFVVFVVVCFRLFIKKKQLHFLKKIFMIISFIRLYRVKHSDSNWCLLECNYSSILL